MMHKKLILAKLVVIFLLFSLPVHLNAQHHDHDHNHSDTPNEVGMAIGAVYAFEEESVATSLHLHYTRMMPDKLSWLGFGVAFESVLDQHKHFSSMFTIVFRPVNFLWISAAPGITYFGESDEFRYSTHFETGLEFNAGFFHLGPMVEYSIAGDEQHLMFGLHIGVPF